MKYLFAGTPEFSAVILKNLLASFHQPCAVLTQPDRPKGRGQKLAVSPVKELALLHDLTVLQPSSLKGEAIQQQLKAFDADVMIVVAYGLLLPQAVLQIPRFGCINIHASLLPKYRGASPIQAAILAGDSQSGVTIMQMDQGLDTGPMLLSRCCELAPDETAQTLHDKLAVLGAAALLTTLEGMQQQIIVPKNQDYTLASYAPKIQKQDAHLDWHKSGEVLQRMVRAYNPWPIAYTQIGGDRIRVHEASFIEIDHQQHPGKIVAIDKNGIDVACGNGYLRICKLQFPGARAMTVEQMLNGRADRFHLGMLLGE